MSTSDTPIHDALGRLSVETRRRSADDLSPTTKWDLQRLDALTGTLLQLDELSFRFFSHQSREIELAILETDSRVREVVPRPTAEEALLLHDAIDRLAHQAHRVIALAPARSEVRTSPHAALPIPSATLASHYALDAKHDDRRALALLASGVLGLAAAATVTVRAASNAHEDNPPQVPDNFAQHFFAYSSPALALILLALIAFFLGNKYRLSSAESRRIGRRVEGLETHLSQMEAPMRSLIRGVATPLIIPRLLEDTDPVREPVWPSPEDLLRAGMNDDYLRARSTDGAEGGDASSVPPS